MDETTPAITLDMNELEDDCEVTPVGEAGISKTERVAIRAPLGPLLRLHGDAWSFISGWAGLDSLQMGFGNPSS